MTLAQVEERARALGLLACRAEWRFLDRGGRRSVSVLLWSTAGVEALEGRDDLEQAVEAAFEAVERKRRG